MLERAALPVVAPRQLVQPVGHGVPDDVFGLRVNVSEPVPGDHQHPVPVED